MRKFLNCNRFKIIVCKKLTIINQAKNLPWDVINAKTQHNLNKKLILTLLNVYSFINHKKRKLMTTQEIATRLADLCREGKFEEAYKELFADDAVSIEPEAMGPFQKETKGLGNMLKKAETFGEMVEEMHGITTSGPIVAGNSFALKLDLDATMKGRGRSTMSEICLYHVKDGKVISEEFFM